MSQLTQYISGQTPPTEYFSAQRIIDGKVFGVKQPGASMPFLRSSSSGGSGTVGAKIGGFARNYLVKIDSALIYGAFKSDVTDTTQNVIELSAFVFMCAAGAGAAHLAPLNNGAEIVDGTAQFAALPPQIAGPNFFLSATPITFVLPAGATFYIGVTQTLGAAFSMAEYISLMYSVTMDNMT